MDEILKLNAQVFAAAGLEESETLEALNINIDDVSNETIAESTGVDIEQVSEEKIKIKEMMKAIAFSTDPIMYIILKKLNKTIKSQVISNMIEAINFKEIVGLTGKMIGLSNGKIVYVSLRPMKEDEISSQQFRKLIPFADKNTCKSIIEVGVHLLEQFYHKYTNFYQVNKSRLVSDNITENTFIASADLVNAIIVFGCPIIWFRVGINITIKDNNESINTADADTNIDTWEKIYT